MAGERVPKGDELRHLRVFDLTIDQLTLAEPRVVISDRPVELATIGANPAADAVLLWDDDANLPDPELLGRLLGGPCHVWHAGLLLGQAGHPAAWNIVHGRAMFSLDVDASIESTSWKISPGAVLIRNEVLSELGGFDAAFDTTSGAALDAGLRWIEHGALMRHVPQLVEGRSGGPPVGRPPSAADGVRIVRRRLGTGWGLWALGRGLQTREVTLGELRRAARPLRESVPDAPKTSGLSSVDHAPDDDARVTVLVPTVGRYAYLEELLKQLGSQTRPPDEVIVVDQNPVEERRDLTDVSPDLPLRVLHLLPAGQCSARNLGLRSSTGSHVLFLDDDDEIPDDLIEAHLRVMSTPEISVSSGLIDDAETGPAPPSDRFRRASDVFPTNNTMIRRQVLRSTGLFDPTYDRGARADHDLGMRSYIAGHLHVHDPRPSVLHHHAPVGGLRTHGARVRTRGNSRRTISKRNLRTATDIYLGLRYYEPRQVDNDLVLAVAATLSGSGRPVRRIIRAVVQLVLLPDTVVKARRSRSEGQRLLEHRPEIPTLPC